MRVFVLIVLGLAGTVLPGVGRVMALPDPPPGEKHLSLLAGQVLTLQCDKAKESCPTITTAPDQADPRWGGLYVPPALARWDVQRLEALEQERDDALKTAVQAGSVLRPVAIGLGIGLVSGGLGSAVTLNSSTTLRASMAIGPCVLGAVLIWLATR